MAIGDVVSTDPFGLLSGAEDLYKLGSGIASSNGQGAGALATALKMSLGDYTLVAVGIILAIGALLISQRQTIVSVAGTASDVANKGAIATFLT